MDRGGAAGAGEGACSPTWREAAQCQGAELAWFFPERGERAVEAHALCDACPVRIECLQSAFVEDTRWGIRGGFSLGHVRTRRKASQWLAVALQDRHDSVDTRIAG